ncbi:MAG: hypothetical protein IPM94_07795 [bacterium]|nr:hypothetical protein [bacterium]
MKHAKPNHRQTLPGLLNLAGLLFISGLLALGATGCGDERGATVPGDVAVDDYEAMDLDKAYGGLTYSDESPAFGDAELEAMSLEDQEAASDDPLQDDAELAGLEAAALGGDDPAAPPPPTVIALRLTWGQLDGAPEDIREEVQGLDWSGRLRVDRGLVVVRRVILFERPRDHLVRPRPDRRTVAWVSHTGPHFDGLIVEVVVPPAAPDSASAGTPAPVMLHLVTPLVALDIPVAELAGLDVTHPVDELGNALRLEGHRVTDEDLCPKGFLGGIWKADRDSTTVEGGVFKGRWVGLWGRLHGFVRGRYGLDSSGERVFFGKYIDRQGRCRGMLAGAWEAADASGRGGFHGEWHNAAATVEGVLGGEYVHAAGRPAGVFSGRWTTLCDQEAAESLR